MLRTPLGRFVLCAVSRSSPQHTLLASELLLPKYTAAQLGANLNVKHASTATAAAHAHRVPPSSSRSSSSPTPSSPQPQEEPTPTDAADPSPHLHFHTLSSKIHPHTLKAIPHTHMSPVQAQILPLLPGLAQSHADSLSSSGAAGAGASTAPTRDVLVKAKTGTGKTMAFLIPAIESRLRSISSHISSLSSSSSPSSIQLTPSQTLQATASYARTTPGCLIISPTRELATQIAVEAASLTKHHKGWGVQLLLGGESKGRQLRMWEGGRKDVVVATPGRVLDLLQSERSVRDVLAKCELLILDEADTLLDMGFREDITRLLTYLPPQPIRQTFLFSATVSRAIQSIAQASLSPNHKYVNCVEKDDSPVHAHIPQYVSVMKEGGDVLPCVMRLIAADQMEFDGRDGRMKSKIIVFLSTTNAVILYSALLRRLLQEGQGQGQGQGLLPTPSPQTTLFEMHAKREQSQRTRVSSLFRSSTAASSILVTSDVSARGVDYPGVTRVIQVGLPGSLDMYVHRVGRTGRGGKREGRGDLVVMDWEEGFVRRKMGAVGVRGVMVGEVEREVKELGDVVVEGGRERWGKENRDAMVRRVHEITSAFGNGTGSASASGGGRGRGREQREDTAELVRAAFSSSAGFYAGRLNELGLQGAEVIRGLQGMWEGMWGVERGRLVLPRGVVESMSGGGGYARGGRGGGGGGARSGGGGGYGGGGAGRSGGGGGGGGGSGYGRDAQRNAQRSGGWGGNSQGWGASTSNWAASPSAPSSSFGDYNRGSSGGGRTGYGYDKGSRAGGEYTRAGAYEKAGRGGRGSDAAWERGGEGSWNGKRGRRD